MKPAPAILIAAAAALSAPAPAQAADLTVVNVSAPRRDESVAQYPTSRMDCRII
jgi:hypothetical protein